MKRAGVVVSVIVVVLCGLLGPRCGAAAGAEGAKDEAPDYSRTIPPEILNQYDPGLLDGSRPKMVAITQEMIWSLRNRPDQGGDVYTLDFEPAEISTVQKNVLLEWIKAGHNVLIAGERCKIYWSVFPGFSEPTEVKNCPGPLPVTLAEHAVNTDCANVTFCTQTEGNVRRTDGTYGTGHDHLFFITLDESAIIVASLDRGMRERDPGGAVAGCMPYGKGGVYFITKLPQGSDTDRWTLNFRQWMLGLPIPGAAEIHVPQAGDDTDSERPPERKTDGRQGNGPITLAGGVSFTSRDAGSEIAITSGGNELTFGLDEAASVILEGRRGEAQSLVIRFRDGSELISESTPEAFSLSIERGREPIPALEQLGVCLK